jgi:hypothetical protein
MVPVKWGPRGQCERDEEGTEEERGSDCATRLCYSRERVWRGTCARIWLFATCVGQFLA